MRVIRYLVLLPVVMLFLGCGSKPPGSQSGLELVDGGVIFRYYDRGARRVNLVGDFNNWSVRSDPMIDKNGDGQWTLLYTLAPGLYEYKFVIDDKKWIADPRNPQTVPESPSDRIKVVNAP